MPSSTDNIRIEILVNGKREAIAGVESFGVLTAILQWVKRDPAALPVGEGAPGLDEWIENKALLTVGGMNAREHLRWLEIDLRTGDEVTLRVLPSGQFDSPIAIKPQCASPAQ
jgi:hypothetical protein